VYIVEDYRLSPWLPHSSSVELSIEIATLFAPQFAVSAPSAGAANRLNSPFTSSSSC